MKTVDPITNATALLRAPGIDRSDSRTCTRVVEEAGGLVVAPSVPTEGEAGLSDDDAALVAPGPVVPEGSVWPQPASTTTAATRSSRPRPSQDRGGRVDVTKPTGLSR
jgi:hypothetical protein